MADQLFSPRKIAYPLDLQGKPQYVFCFVVNKTVHLLFIDLCASAAEGMR